MTRLIRSLIVLLCTGFATLAPAHNLIRECPSSSTAYSGDSTGSSKYIYELFPYGPAKQSSGESPGEYVGFTLHVEGSAGNLLELVFSGKFSPDSPCKLTGAVEFAGPNGELKEEKPVIVTHDGYTLILEPFSGDEGRQMLRYRLKDGEAIRCTVEELSSVAVTATLLKTHPDEDGCSGLACTETLSAQTLYSAFRRKAMIEDIAILTGGSVIVDPQCTAVAKYTGGSTDPYKLTWDVDRSLTSQGEKENTELLIYVTPRIDRSTMTPAGGVISCEEALNGAEHVVNFLPKVTLDMVVSDGLGKPYTETVELTQKNQAVRRTFSYTYDRLNRQILYVDIKGQGSSCFDVRTVLNKYNEDGDTQSSVPLGAVYSKAVPPPEFPDGNGE
jgi:hypothetical protein